VPVTLQILIENALKHNTADRTKPLTIRVSVQDDYLVVENTLQERKIVETSNRQGLDNLSTLYRILTSKPVILEKTADQFIIKVPLL
jgi:sensor histidine kinase YesM